MYSGRFLFCCQITVTIKQPPLLNTRTQHFEEGNSVNVAMMDDFILLILSTGDFISLINLVAVKLSIKESLILKPSL